MWKPLEFVSIYQILDFLRLSKAQGLGWSISTRSSCAVICLLKYFLYTTNFVSKFYFDPTLSTILSYISSICAPIYTSGCSASPFFNLKTAVIPSIVWTSHAKRSRSFSSANVRHILTDLCIHLQLIYKSTLPPKVFTEFDAKYHVTLVLGGFRFDKTHPCFLIPLGTQHLNTASSSKLFSWTYNTSSTGYNFLTSL